MAAPGTPAFRGRARERQALDGLLDRVRGGESAVLVIRGEAGIGKTALMRYCARQAAGCQLAHMAACPFLRSVMRHSFLSPRRSTYSWRTPSRFDPYSK